MKQAAGNAESTETTEIERLLRAGDRIGAIVLLVREHGISLTDAKARALQLAHELGVDEIPPNNVRAAPDSISLRWTATMSDSQRLWNWSYVRAAVDFRFELDVNGTVTPGVSERRAVSIYALAASLERDGAYEIFLRTPPS